jgi:hypothetical protein
MAVCGCIAAVCLIFSLRFGAQLSDRVNLALWLCAGLCGVVTLVSWSRFANQEERQLDS